MTKYPRETIVWADHFIDYGDHQLKDIQDTSKKAYLGEYTGFLVTESKLMVVLASNIWEDGSISDPMYIMKRAIKTRTRHD